jgi:uncharacterized UPF0146 family protein
MQPDPQAGVPPSAINLYGDVLIPTTGVHGGDVSSQRVDELDTACLDYLKTRAGSERRPRAIDIGGGHGAQSKRMAASGADVVLVDLTDRFEDMRAYNSQAGREAITFHRADIRDADVAQIAKGVDAIYSQRMLSCIRHHEASDLMRRIHDASAVGAHCFISAGGIQTEIGDEYGDRTLPIERRWATSSPRMAQKHQIFAPECLYSEQELIDLLRSCGFVLVRSWTSAFGNPKVICRK